MLSLRPLVSPPPIPSEVARFFDQLEHLEASQLAAIAETDATRVLPAANACMVAAGAPLYRDARDGAELAACRWADRRLARIERLEREYGDGTSVAALTRFGVAVVQLLAQWATTAIVVRGAVAPDVYELATAPFYGFIRVPAPDE